MAENVVAANLSARAAALALFPKARKNLGPFASAGTVATGGGTVRAKLYNVGITTGIWVQVTANVTIGTLAGTLSPQAPHNMIARVQVIDYDGTSRVSIPGYGLWLRNSIRNRSLWGQKDGTFGVMTAGAASTVNAPEFIEPAIPVATATANLTFMTYIPLANDPMTDLRGAVLSQTALGEMYLNIDFNPTFYANANDDAVFNGAATTTVAVNSISVNLWQDYLIIQSVGGKSVLPALDLLTVNELNWLRTTDNLQVGQEKLVNYPNVRSVNGVYAWYVNNGVMTANLGAITPLRVIANGNAVLTEQSGYLQRIIQRNYMLGEDMPPSTYIFDTAATPIETASYGNVQIGLTPTAVTAGNTHIDVVFESMYTKSATLPGLTQ